MLHNFCEVKLKVLANVYMQLHNKLKLIDVISCRGSRPLEIQSLQLHHVQTNSRQCNGQ